MLKGLLRGCFGFFKYRPIIRVSYRQCCIQTTVIALSMSKQLLSYLFHLTPKKGRCWCIVRKDSSCRPIQDDVDNAVTV